MAARRYDYLLERTREVFSQADNDHKGYATVIELNRALDNDKDLKVRLLRTCASIEVIEFQS